MLWVQTVHVLVPSMLTCGSQTFQEHVQSFYCHELNDLFLSPDRVTNVLNSKSAVHHIQVPAFATTVLTALFG